MTEERDIKAFRVTYNLDLRTKACDTARNLLPAATLTNLGMFGVGRALEHMLTRLYSSHLVESQELAEALHGELNKSIPLYVKRAGPDLYRIQIEAAMKSVVKDSLSTFSKSLDEVIMINIGRGENFDNQMIAAMLFHYTEMPFADLVRVVQAAPMGWKTEIVNAYCGERKNRHQRPGRALEWGYPLTYEIVGNFGIFRDLHRHRMLTQIRQLLATRLGFDIPPLIEEAGLADGMKRCRDEVAELYENLRDEVGQDIAQYAVLFGFRLRWLMGMNDREAMHVFELRTIPQGHPDYRRICQKMQKLSENQSLLRASLRKFVDSNDYFWSRAESESAQRRKERKFDI